MTEQQNGTRANDAKRILVVDDSVETRQMVSLILQRQGYVVYTAGSGNEALKIVGQEALPHLAILDILMPGMDGVALAEELGRIGDIPILFLSVLADTNSKVEGLNKYAEDYLTKPFVIAELLARVRRVLLRTTSSRKAHQN
jgi:DNA-binding response OmpR family regulator